MENKVRISFYGGVGKPTGSNFLLEDTEGKTKILIDCGLIQGCRVCEDENREPFPYDPKTIDFLVVTHGHVDHVGRIPKLVREGFRGKIISTPPTREIGELMLHDSLGVLGKEARHDGKPPIYEKNDVEAAVALWQELPYRKELPLGSFTLVLKNAGHILGSSMAEFSYNGKKIVFTGDLGNSPAPLLPPTDLVSNATVLVMESVYGDRNHEKREERKQLLEDAIEDSVKVGGALMIPAFSLERTQELLYELDDLVAHGRIPETPIFIDSPLAIDVTKIYKKYEDYFNREAKGVIKNGEDIFNFRGVKFTYTTEESKAILRTPNPKVIIAGSGMSNGGRIIHHEKSYLPDPKSMLLIIGYQVPGSLGRILQDGGKRVRILGEDVYVSARVRTIHGYSAHKDSDHLLQFVENSTDTLKKVFVVMGEPKSSLFLTQRIRDYLGLDARVPKENETVEINLD